MFFIFIYFSSFACLVLRLQGFKSDSWEAQTSSGVRVFLGNKSQKGLFTVTALMWCDCQSFHLCLPFPWTVQHGGLSKHLTWIHCLIVKTIAGNISVVYFSLWFLHLWFNEIVWGAAEILRGKVRCVCVWGGGWSDILDILWFSVYLSLFDLNETTGCRTDPACESDPATLHTSCRNTRRANSCSTPVVDAICERELLKRTVMVQFIINHIWFARLP